MSRWRIAMLLALFSPIWIPAAAFAGVWWGLWCLLTLLPLPVFLSGPLVLFMMVVMFPFYPIIMLTQGAIGRLISERIFVDHLGLQIIGRGTATRFVWQDIAAITQIYSPPMHHFVVVLRSGEELTLSQFADTEQLCQEASNHRVSVQYLREKSED